LPHNNNITAWNIEMKVHPRPTATVCVTFSEEIGKVKFCFPVDMSAVERQEYLMDLIGSAKQEINNVCLELVGDINAGTFG
jgi:hypothetical protein